MRSFVGGVTVTKGDHTITHCMVADESARINLSLWDAQVFIFSFWNFGMVMVSFKGEMLRSGDIIRLIGGYCTLYKNSLVLYSGCMHGTIERIGQYRMLFKEHPNMSGVTWVTDPTTKMMVSIIFI